MNDIQIFKSEDFGNIRIATANGEPWFVGKDVTDILGYTNPSKALADHVDDDDKLNNESLSSLGQRGGWLINESGLYSLILSSKMPNAKKFKHCSVSQNERRRRNSMTRGQKKREEIRRRRMNLLEDIVYGALLFIGTAIITILMMAM